MISPANLAYRAALMARSFDTAVTVQRLAEGAYTPVGAATRCLVEPLRLAVSYEGLPELLRLTGWILVLPAGTDVRAGDRLVTAAGTYLVQRTDRGESYPLDTECHCVQLFDADGVATYLPLNATISLEHQEDGAVVSASRRVRLVWPLGNDPIQPAGALVAGYLYDVPDGAYRLGDVVTILQIDGHADLLPAVDALSVDLVERISDGVPLLRVHLIGGNT